MGLDGKVQPIGAKISVVVVVCGSAVHTRTTSARLATFRQCTGDLYEHLYRAYLIFAIFLHRQNLWLNFLHHNVQLFHQNKQFSKNCNISSKCTFPTKKTYQHIQLLTAHNFPSAPLVLLMTNIKYDLAYLITWCQGNHFGVA